MCNSCISGWGACGCTGGSVFAVCPASKGLECPVCEHYPKSLAEGEKYTGPNLAELIDPAILEKDRAAFKAAHPEQKG